MQVSLEELRPVLVATSASTEEMMKQVCALVECFLEFSGLFLFSGECRVDCSWANSHSRSSGRKSCQRSSCQGQGQLVLFTHPASTVCQIDKQAIQEDCEAELAEVLPILEEAIDALNALDRNDITDLRSYKNPPFAAKVTCEALCVVFGLGPARVPDPSGSGKMVPAFESCFCQLRHCFCQINDYWEVSKKRLLSDPKLLENLKSFDKCDESLVFEVYRFVSLFFFLSEIIFLKKYRLKFDASTWIVMNSK